MLGIWGRQKTGQEKNSCPKEIKSTWPHAAQAHGTFEALQGCNESSLLHVALVLGLSVHDAVKGLLQNVVQLLIDGVEVPEEHL